MEKMTNKKALVYVIENYDLPKEIEEKIEKIIAQLDKKASGTSAKSAAKVELDEKLKTLAVNWFKSPFSANFDTGITVTELQNEVEGLSLLQGISSSKVTYILGLLCDEKIIERKTVKGRSRYSLIK